MWLPDIQNIHQKYWKGMKDKNLYLAEFFPDPPLVAYRRQKNVKDYLLRSKLAKNTIANHKEIKGA